MSAAGENPRWPAGMLLPEAIMLPDTSYFTQWACRTLQAAKTEITHVVDGMIDDLEDLSAAACERAVCAGMSTRRLIQRVSHETAALDDEVGEEEDDPCIRVHDLQPPAPVRSEYEQETAEADVPPCEDGFELIDFEAEARIIVLEEESMSL
uniref:Uncharacterized protein n=1 Tax=Coccolithus braarudii TaxID=221442 RepID=A0A6T7IMY8_9EUKA|mmetsp:Transcript_42915/g.91611  ORF Transcript_42915/g.91611 Transcript_42915/m.91611 type:complete len:152 (+) Transcript_42915:131-586(+)